MAKLILVDEELLIDKHNCRNAAEAIQKRISSGLGSDLEIIIRTMNEEDASRKKFTAGETASLFPEKKYLIEVNPYFEDEVTIPHELSHILLNVLHYPRFSFFNEDKGYFPKHIDIGKEIAMFAQHNLITKILEDLGLDVFNHYEKFLILYEEEETNFSPYGYDVLLDVLALLKFAYECPRLKNRFISLFKSRSPDMVKTYEELSRLIKTERLQYSKPEFMFKALVRLVNIVENYKVNRFGDDNKPLQYVCFYDPIFIAKKNLHKPAIKYFWFVGRQDEGTPGTIIRLIYNYRAEPRNRIGVCGLTFRGTRALLEDIITRPQRFTVSDFLDWLTGQWGQLKSKFRFVD